MAELGLELLRLLGPGCQDDEGANEVATALEVAHTDDGARSDRVVGAQHVLDPVRAEGPPAARDDVLRAGDVREESLLVGDGDVAGEVEIAAERALRLLGRLPVAGEQRRRIAANCEVAFDPARELVSLIVDDHDVKACEGTSERAGPLGIVVAAVTGDDVRLGLPVPVVDGQAPALPEDLDHLGLEHVTRRHEPSQAWGPEARELVVLGKRPELARRLTEDGRTDPVDVLEPLLRVELALVDDGLGSA